mmetsp:Transcript_27106/g.68203  ORF Transcript_27106/g.68203 Transcript_27106/m.68203 type:complete len:286 (-) Transcript_27106:388-1245(-)
MEVTLNIYDVTNTTNEQANAVIMRVNNVTRDFSMGGVFHGAVELNGKEWSFGYCDDGSGVYACLPKLNPQYTYRESVPMGVTALTLPQVNAVLQELRLRWQGNTYDLLGRNCCHFCEEFCSKLGVGPVPAWLNRFAYGAEATVNAIHSTYTQIQWLGNSIASAVSSTVAAAAQLGAGEAAAPSEQGVLRVMDRQASRSGSRLSRSSSLSRPSSSQPSSKGAGMGAGMGAVPVAGVSADDGVLGINSPARRTLRRTDHLTEARVAAEEPITWSMLSYFERRQQRRV